MSDNHTFVAIPNHVVYNIVDGQALVMNSQTGSAYALSAFGTRIWELVAQLGNLEAVRDELLSEYEVSTDCLKHDLYKFVGELEEKQVLVTSSEHIG